MKKYIAFTHHNSRNSERRGLLRKFDKLTGKFYRVDHTTIQVYRDQQDGEPLPWMACKAILRSFRGKITPHVGAKQRMKQLRRDELAITA